MNELIHPHLLNTRIISVTLIISFQVFGTEVMVEVAKNLDAPIKGGGSKFDVFSILVVVIEIV